MDLNKYTYIQENGIINYLIPSYQILNLNQRLIEVDYKINLNKLKLKKMGWWSVDILGGDTPYDFKDSFYDICGIDEFTEDSKKRNLVSKELFAKHLNEMLLKIEKDYEPNIGLQVLAVMMMESGAEMSQELKAKFIKAGLDDEWANEDEDRKEAIDNYIKALNAYDNINPIVIKSRGLFEVIAQHINGGKSGLVNKKI